MAYIVDTDAFLRLISLDPSDPFIDWISAHKVRPFVSPVTVGRARHTINHADLSEPARAVAHERLKSTVLAFSEATPSAYLAPFEPQAALLWGLLIDLVGPESTLALDLVPAASAMHYSYTLIEGDPGGPMAKLKPVIPPELGLLQIITADDPG